MKKNEKSGRDSGELFSRYMHLISSREFEQIYRLKSSTGEGIMRQYNVSKGIYYIYSEIERYYPGYQDQKHLIRYVEIMYLVDGHADFEMENSYSITEIAGMCGYSNANKFSAAFRKATGVNPREWTGRPSPI